MIEVLVFLLFHLLVSSSERIPLLTLAPGGSIPNTPGMPPAPPSGGSPTTPSTTSPSTDSSGQRFTNKADCERAGGKWHGVQKKCDMGG